MNSDLIALVDSNISYFEGLKFSGNIYGKFVEGVITVEYDRFYLCQNVMEGTSADDKKGYKYSWVVSKYNFKRLLEEKKTEDIEYFKLHTINLTKTEGGEYIVCTYESKTRIPLNYCFKTLHGDINAEYLVNNIDGIPSGFAPHNKERFRMATNLEAETYELIGKPYDVTNVPENIKDILYQKMSANFSEFETLYPEQCYYLEYKTDNCLNVCLFEPKCEIKLKEINSLVDCRYIDICNTCRGYNFILDFNTSFIRKANSFENFYFKRGDKIAILRYYSCLVKESYRYFVDEENNEVPENPLPLGYTMVMSNTDVYSLFDRETFYSGSRYGLNYSISKREMSNLEIIGYFKKKYICKYKTNILLVNPNHLRPLTKEDREIKVSDLKREHHKDNYWISLPLFPKNTYIKMYDIKKDEDGEFISSDCCLHEGRLRYTKDVFNRRYFYNIKTVTIINEETILKDLLNSDKSIIEEIKNSPEENFIFITERFVYLPLVGCPDANYKRMFTKSSISAHLSEKGTLTDLGIYVKRYIKEIPLTSLNKNMQNVYLRKPGDTRILKYYIERGNIYRFEDNQEVYDVDYNSLSSYKGCQLFIIKDTPFELSINTTKQTLKEKIKHFCFFK